MIINENLYEGDAILKAKNSITYASIPKLDVGSTYTVSFSLEQKNGGSGKSTVCIFDNSITKRTFGDTFNLGFNCFSFVYSEISTRLLFYSDQYGQTMNRESIYHNIKIEKGDKATPYISNKNSLDPSKQAVFKAGGGIPRGVSTLIGLEAGYAS